LEVQCCGDRHSTKEMAANLTELISNLITRFPKFSQHLKGLKGIFIYDDFTDTKFHKYKDTYGFYLNRDKEIYIAINNAYNYELAIHTLIHEIGHHLVNKKMGIDIYYNSKTRNRAYLKEEIRAEKYALFIIDRFFINDYPIMLRFLGLFNKFQKIKNSIIYNIKEFLEEIEKCPKPSPRVYSYSNYTTVSWTSSTSYNSTWSTGTSGTYTTITNF
jgi:hypothetical protein